MRSTPRSAQKGAAILAVLAIIVAVAVVAILVVGTLSAARVKDARRGWDETFGSWDEIMRRYPATEANATALELERMAAALGLDIAPRHIEGRPEPTEEGDRAFRAFRGELFGVYSKPNLERAARGEIDEPPAVLTAFMSQHADELEALRRHLITSPVPVWESDLSRLWEAPIPNLLGQINLHKLLTNIALAELHAGDVDEALANIEASYNLSGSLHESPLLISQLILIAATRMQLGVLRHVPDLPAAWIERMESHDYRESFQNAMKCAGWTWLYSDAYDGIDAPVWRQIFLSSAMRPYAKLCLADMSDAWRERMANLERVDALCDHDLAARGASAEIPVPRWNAIGEGLVPNFGNATDRVARLELDLEHTRLLYEADEVRRANGGRWPDTSPASRISESCPGDEWVYTAGADGLRIEFSREISWPDQRGAVLPTRSISRAVF